MRIFLLTAVALCLTQAGCQTPGRGTRGPTARTNGGNPAPFLGAPTTGPASTSPGPATSPAADRGSLTSGGPQGRDGVLAGRILDQDSRLRPGAIIQVIDLDSSREGAPVSVLANREGYFDINGLEIGKSYRLVARVKDGPKTLVGSARVVPPNIRVAIFLNDETSGEDAALSAIAGGPAASLGAPIKNPGGVTTPLPPGSEGATPPVPPAVSTTTPATAGADLIADKGKKTEDGFTREVPSVPAEIGGPGREHNPEKPASSPSLPPPPPGANPDDGPPPPAAPSAAPPSGSVNADVPAGKTVVPSCVRVGQRVENFSLYDVKGNVFELARECKGKVVLLDFWFTECGPCRRAIPKLNQLQSKYGRYGLEVVGVTYEKGSLAEKQRVLEQARRRYGLSFNYRVLFGGGGSRSCPVAEQLEVVGYPTLVLLDETGRILWRSQGIDEQSAYEMEMTIYRKLFPRGMAGR